MSTFNEMHSRLQQARYRKAILMHLIEYVDESFLHQAGTDPKHMLLTEDQQRVPAELFESVVADTLGAELQQLDAEIHQILGSELVTGAGPGAPAAPPAPAKKSNKKRTKEHHA